METDREYTSPLRAALEEASALAAICMFVGMILIWAAIFRDVQ